MRRIPVIYGEVKLVLPCGHWRLVPSTLPITQWGTVECFGCLLGLPVEDS